MSGVVRTLVIGLVAVGLATCASARENEPVVQAVTTVTVENQNFLDMNVYVLEGAQRVRLGTVPGISTRTLTIPERLVFGVGSLRFQVDPIGSARAPMSQEITVRAGDALRLVIPPS
jgi:hypothetical protein